MPALKRVLKFKRSRSYFSILTMTSINVLLAQLELQVCIFFSLTVTIIIKFDVLAY